MSTNRLDNYKGRWWAYKENDQGVIVSVHHFSSEEVRNGWVSMDPEVRFVATERHPNVKQWLRAERTTANWITAKTPWWRRALKFLHITD